MRKLQDLLELSEKGYKDLKKAILACTLTNFSLMLPFSITVLIFTELLKPLMEDTISWINMGVYFGVGIGGLVIVFFVKKYDYRKTYIACYQEGENTRLSVAERIRKLPMSYFNNRDLSDLTNSLTGDCSVLEHLLSYVVPQLLANAISCTVICVFLAFFDWRLALCVFSTLPISFAIIFISKKAQDRQNAKEMRAKLDASEQVQEYIDGIKVIKSCDMAGDRSKELNSALLRLKKIAIKTDLFSGTVVTGSQLILQVGVGITILVGAYLLTAGMAELIPILMFFLIVVRIYGPILTELTFLSELFYSIQSVKRMKNLNEATVQEGSSDIAIPGNELTFHNVSFGYNKEDVLKNVTFTIPEHKITALVGPSGSGKSTIAKLAARFWDVTSGQITLGGVDIKTIDPEHLMDYMSFVFQDVILFNDTVYNNIKVGNMNATEEEVIAAAKAACCDEFVERMPDGYQTMLGENGSTVSGGERQRISIARALLKKAPIILLDEATASLDPENEVLIQQAVSHLIEGKTVLVIAHRLRTITGADKIIVLNNGTVTEEGTHQQLLANGMLYAKLYSLQQESADWSV